MSHNHPAVQKRENAETGLPGVRVRVGSAVVLAAALAVLTAWALRDHAEFLPSGRQPPNLLGASGHGQASGGYVPPPAILGHTVASYAGLGMFALHALLIAVLAVSCCLRRLLRQSSVDNNGVLASVIFAGAVAVVAALITAGMAAVIIGTAISFAASLAAALTVLRYAFVLTLVGSVVFGRP